MAAATMRIATPDSATALPGEILGEILTRLPLRCVLRCGAVCRSWNATVSSDEFRALYASLMHPKLLLVAPAMASGHDRTRVYSCSPSSGPACNDNLDLLLTLDDAPGGYVQTASPVSCRGLTLLHDALTDSYYVVNAATRASARLPPCQDAAELSSAGLAFDDRTKRHKVVRLFVERNQDGEKLVKCHVCTLGAGRGELGGDRWRPAAVGVPPTFRVAADAALRTATANRLTPVLVHGSLHWLSLRGDTTTPPTVEADTIMSFSVTEETFGWVRSPSPMAASPSHLVELHGHLCAVYVNENQHEFNRYFRTEMKIWRLHDYPSGVWSPETSLVCNGHAETGRDPKLPIFRVIGATGNGTTSGPQKIIITRSQHMVFSYDVEGAILELILSIGGATHVDARIQTNRISLLQETLAPVHGTTSEETKATKEILLRLPPKSVVQSKLVCSQWRRLIESASFTRSYHHARMSMNKCRPKIMLVCTVMPCAVQQPPFRFVPMDVDRLSDHHGATSAQRELMYTKVVCSKPCHGLNLLVTQGQDYLCNPCTGFCMEIAYQGALARPECTGMPTQGSLQGHAFSVGYKSVGLGFDPVRQEHVAVIILYQRKDFVSRQYEMTCLVWRSSTTRRCVVQQGAHAHPPLPVNDMPPAHVDGVLYWMSDPALGNDTSHAIVWYDTGRGKFGRIPCPSAYCNERARRLFVVEIGGSLCTVVADVLDDDMEIRKREHGRWESAYKVCLKGCPGFSLMSNVVVPLAVDPNDGRILLSTGRELGFYDPTSRTIEALCQADDEAPDAAAMDQRMTRASDDGLRLAKCPRLDRDSGSGKKTVRAPVAMLYEESPFSYPRVLRRRTLR